MAISAKCPGCGKRLSGPDSAAGHKVKCPKCGQIVQFPDADAGGQAEAVASSQPRKPSAADLAQALSEKPPPARARKEEAAREGEQREAPKDEPSAEEPSPPTLTPASGPPSSRRSSTTMSRMLARSSPYKTLRLLGVILFIVGVVVSVLVFLGGLVGLIVGSISGVLHWAEAVGIFIAAVVAAAVVLVVARAGSELIRLLADVGDRTRQMTLLFEDHVAQDRTEDL